MSLEKAMEENTAVLAKLLSATERLIELRENAIETVKTTAAPAAKAEKAAATTKAAEPKAAEPKADAPADDSAYEEAKVLIATYTKGSDRPEEVQARKGKVKFLLRHKALVKPGLKTSQEMLSDTVKDTVDPEKSNGESFSVTDVLAEKIPQLVKNLNKVIADGDLTQPAAADSSDDLL